jgi:SAM-dependent methyltransferase
VAEKQWFETWFDSPYYHTLYDHRDFAEADTFINNILSYLSPKLGSTFLDLACGAGRHSKYINSLGYNVIGADLSPKSIETAKSFSNSKLNFFVHDMREKIPNQSFNYIFNLFTSFGYFENEDDNLRVLTSIKSYLEPQGKVIIDFMNATNVVNNLVASETIIKQGITFSIEREVIEDIINKRISFAVQGEKFYFEERVQTLNLKKFNDLCNKAGFSIVKVFGNYALDEFIEDQSDRLIMVLEEKY